MSNMISEEILSILVCPENKESLILAEASEVEMINEHISKGGLFNADGAAVPKESSDGFLIRADRKVAYPIKDGIPVLLIEEGIILPDGEI